MVDDVHKGDRIILEFREKDISVTPYLKKFDGQVFKISRVFTVTLPNKTSGRQYQATGLVSKFGVPFTLTRDMFRVIERRSDE